MATIASPPLLSAPQPPQRNRDDKGPIWWSNAIFFVGMHVAALLGAFHFSPWWNLDRRTFALAFTSWQLATFGITIGYHRLWSHRSFTASFPLRVVLAGMGCLGFQGSIRWWVLRHRLHHRFTDTESDPYNANRGLYYSHMGWIFRKPTYPRMKQIDRKDLDLDPVVQFQHKHYVPLTLGLGLILPTLVGWSYGDPVGGFFWGGVLARIMIWHMTFFINSLAHYLGDQKYSEELTARGNLFLAIFTGGEANHNYHHAFPSDYRNGPQVLDWDPTKWTIYFLHHFTPFVPRVKQTPKSEILLAQAHVASLRTARTNPSPSLDESLTKDPNSSSEDSSFAHWSSYASATSEEGEGGDGICSSSSASSSSTSGSGSGEEGWSDDGMSASTPYRSNLLRRRQGAGVESASQLPVWSRADLLASLITSTTSDSNRPPLLLVISGYVVDATAYAPDHPGGVAVLRKYAVGKGEEKSGVDATKGFEGGENDHGWSAREKLKTLRIARLQG